MFLEDMGQQGASCPAPRPADRCATHQQECTCGVIRGNDDGTEGVRRRGFRRAPPAACQPGPEGNRGGRDGGPPRRSPRPQGEPSRRPTFWTAPRRCRLLARTDWGPPSLTRCAVTIHRTDHPPNVNGLSTSRRDAGPATIRALGVRTCRGVSAPQQDRGGASRRPGSVTWNATAARSAHRRANEGNWVHRFHSAVPFAKKVAHVCGRSIQRTDGLGSSCARPSTGRAPT
jgi:hypothetical protein